MFIDYVRLTPANIGQCASLWSGAETYAPGEPSRVLAASARLLDEERATGAMVLENGVPRAFALTVFAPASFVDGYLQNPYPHIGRQLLLGTDSPTAPGALTRREIGEGNAGDGLELVVANCALSPAARDPATVYGIAIRSFFDVHRGYRIRRVTHEVFGDTSIQLIESSRSYEVRRTFELNTRRGALRSLVGTVTREQAAAWGNPILAMFAYSPPRLRFTAAEQRLLAEALPGVTDQTLSSRLGIPLSAVKGRWSRLQMRARRHAPDLFRDLPLTIGSSRGNQTRHVILQYVRDHPSELTPYVWSLPETVGGVGSGLTPSQATQAT